MAISAEAAALIAAGVAAAVNVAGIGVAHHLTLTRERRAHRRQEVSDVIKRAALALYVNTESSKLDKYEDATPGSFAAQAPRAVAVMAHGFPRHTELQVTLGDHPLVQRYMEAVTATAELEVEMERSLVIARRRGAPEEESIEAAAQAVVKAKFIRDEWTAAARRYVAKL